MNDNYNGATPYCEGGYFNIIDANGEPRILRNTASYYTAKLDADGVTERWADGMARRLRAAANDNGQAKKTAAERSVAARRRAA